MNKKMFYLLRSTQIISLIVVCAVMAYHYMTLHNTANAIKYQQTEKFSYSLTNLAASEASRFLSHNKVEDLQLLIDDLSNDPIVRDATIYDHLGIVITQSTDVLPLSELLNLNASNSEDVQGIIPHIAELYEDNNKIGYIRISLEQDKILSLITEYQDKSRTTLLYIFILAFLAGTIIMAIMFRRVEIIYFFFAKKLSKRSKAVVATE